MFFVGSDLETVYYPLNSPQLQLLSFSAFKTDLRNNNKLLEVVDEKKNEFKFKRQNDELSSYYRVFRLKKNLVIL